MSEALELYNQESQGLAISRPPDVVLTEARKAASALGDVIRGKAKPVMFNGEQYLEFEDWQTVGRFYGVAAKVVSTCPVQFGDVMGFEARAVVVRPDGAEISAADSMCLNDEPNWKQKPLFQLRSMAQTRACAKALRNVLAWVVVLAGYKPTPAEEMDGVRGFSRPTGDRPPVSQPKPANKPAETTPTNTARGIIEAVSVKSSAPGAKKPWTKYGVKLDDDWYGTFDSSLGQCAESLKGEEVEIGWKADGDYRTIVTLVAASVADVQQSDEDRQLDLAAAKG